MKKILLVSLSAGAGHVQAAKALYQTAQKNFPEFEVRYIDMAEYLSAPLRHTIVDTYDFLVKKFPGIWGYIYKKANSKKNMDRLYKLTDPLHTLNVKKFLQYVEKFQPDVVITTHSFPAQILRRAKSNLADIPLGVVVTDYALHKFWLIDRVNWYFVPCSRVRDELIAQGVQTARIFETGIPVSPVFFENTDKVFLQKKYQVTPGSKVVLLLSGGQGMVRIDEIALDLQKKWKQNVPLQIVAIAGSNKKLQKKLEQVQAKSFHPQVRLCVVGWTDRMNEYMRLADVVVTKSGGLTTAECLVLKKSMIIVCPIPGQEEENARFVRERGLGVEVKNKKEIVPAIVHALMQPSTNVEIPQENEGGAMKILQALKKHV